MEKSWGVKAEKKEWWGEVREKEGQTESGCA